MLDLINRALDGLERLQVLSSLATVTLLARNSEHNPNQINKRPTFGTVARNGDGEDRVLYVYSVVQGRP